MSEYGSEEERWEDPRAPGYEPAVPSDFRLEESEDAGFEEVGARGIASCSSSAAATT